MILQALLNAFRSIWTKKTRSILTMLGVIIGVAQIIALIGLGQGVKKSVSDQVTQLGTNVLFVLPGKLQDSKGNFNPAASVGASTLTEKDLTLLKSQQEITTITPVSLLAGAPSVDKTLASGTMLVAVEPDYFKVMTTMKLMAGRLFTDADNTNKAKVILLGKSVVTQLFPTTAPTDIINKTVTVGKNTFTVVGIIEDKQAASSFGGDSFNAMSFLPYLTGKATNDNVQIFRIVMKLDPNVDTKEYAKKLTTLLTDQHGAEDITVFSQEDLLSVVDNILSLITTAIVGLGVDLADRRRDWHHEYHARRRFRTDQRNRTPQSTRCHPG